MADSDVLQELRTELTEVETAIQRIQRGEFEIRRQDRYFAIPSLAELRAERNRLRRAISRREGGGSTYVGVPARPPRRYY